MGITDPKTGYPAQMKPWRMVGVMATGRERNWTAHVVIASDHAGLRPLFQDLEAEMLRVLARLDDPHDVREYLRALKWASLMWGNKQLGLPTDK